jgi:hypothetical protein
MAEQKVYVFMTEEISYRGLPKALNEMVIHTLVGNVTEKQVRFSDKVAEDNRTLLTYKKQFYLGTNVFKTWDEASAAAKDRLLKEVERHQQTVVELLATLKLLAKESPF